MNTKINHRRVLMGKLHEIENLPGNWDEKGASRASARAVGQYKGFLDLVTEHKLEYAPQLQSDGSILVQWTGRLNSASATFTIHFLVNGGIQLGLNGALSDTIPSSEERDRLRDFIYAAG